MLVSLRNIIESSATLPLEPTTKAVVIVRTVALIVFATAIYCAVRIVQRCWKPKDCQGDEVNKLGKKILNKDPEKIEEKKLVLKTNEIVKKIHPKVRETLNRLFEGSKYGSIEKLPPYPIMVDNTENFASREHMTKPVMIGDMDDGRQFILIKADCIVTEENRIIFFNTGIGTRIEKHIVLYQRFDPTRNRFLWESNRTEHAEPVFFSWTFISDDGSLNELQKTNFDRLKTLLKTGEGQDINGLTWTIPSE